MNKVLLDVTLYYYDAKICCSEEALEEDPHLWLGLREDLSGSGPSFPGCRLSPAWSNARCLFQPAAKSDLSGEWGCRWCERVSASPATAWESDRRRRRSRLFGWTFHRNTSKKRVSRRPCVSLPFSVRWPVFSGPRWTWQAEAGWPRWSRWDSFRFVACSFAFVFLFWWEMQRLERLGSSVPRSCGASYLWELCASEGREHKPPRLVGGLTRRRGGVAFWEISEAAVRTIWSLRDQASISTAGMRTSSHVAFVFKMRTRNVHLIKLRTFTAQPTLAPPSPNPLPGMNSRDNSYSFQQQTPPLLAFNMN